MQPQRNAGVDGQGQAAHHGVTDALKREAANTQLRPHSIKRLTIVIPLHDEAANIEGVVRGLLATLRNAGVEPRIFLVDDGSTDGSLSLIRSMASHDPDIDYISFSRNFGKEAALMAGLRECGDDFDALAYLDSDGQHTAADLLRLVEIAQNPEFNLVCGVRSDRNYQTPNQRRMSSLFYGLFRKFGDVPIDEGAGDFNVMRPKVVQALRGLTEEHPFMKGLVGWVGFSKKLVPVTIAPRAGGSAKSSTARMLKLACGAILSFSSWPLRAWSGVGIACAALAIAYLLLIVVDTVVFGRDIPGYASTIVLLLGLGGLQLLSIGIVGEYVARIYDNSKNRPTYIVAEDSRKR